MKWVNLLFVPLSVFLLFPISVSATVSKINFTTESQNIGIGAISEVLTIQVQDSSGSLSETAETLDLTFTSTSGSGEFLGSTGNAVSKTMNKNTANRSFYYRDSKEGTHTITVAATGRDSGKTFSVSQQINVGPSSNATAPSGSSQNSSGASATTASTPVSKIVVNSLFEIYGGSDRLTSVGSPINFQVLVKKSESSVRPEFSWSFGDGSVGGGENTIHTYKYSGTYAVVVNAKFGKQVAISRLKVTVIEPAITISVKADSIEIRNNSREEINLFNWKLAQGIKSFIFQPDTIILPNSSIQFDGGLLRLGNLSDGNIQLFDSLGKLVAPVSTPVDSQEPPVETVSEESHGITEKHAAAVILSVPAPTSSKVIIYEAPELPKSWWHRIIDFFLIGR